MAIQDDVETIVAELNALGSASIKKVLLNHGAVEPLLGVKIADMKPIVKRIGTNYALALELYRTGISDAKYLAGLIADDARMSRADLEEWVQGADWSLHTESTVPWVASGSPAGMEAALAWIDSDKWNIVSAGWRTLASIAVVKKDAELDVDLFRHLIRRVEETLYQAPEQSRSSMVSFIAGAGVGISELTEEALAAGERIGTVSVDRGKTACKLPDAARAIKAAASKGVIGKKRKTAKC